MSSLNSIKQKLRPLGFYNLNNDSLIHAELSAYAVALDTIEAQLAEIEKEKFICTAEDYGLNTRERIFGTEQSDKDTQTRRDILLYRYAINSENFNEKSIKKAMKNAGIIGYIIEAPQKNTIYINCIELENSKADKNSIKSVVEEFLPAHLECIFDFRKLQWNLIDNKDYTFETIDNKNLTWNDIDNFEEI